MMKRVTLALMLLSASTSYGQIGYVDVTNGNDTANGASWATAWKTLTNAITKSAGKPTNTFYLAQGVYYTPTSAGTDITTNNIYGGYKNDGSGTRDWTIYPTILDGGGSNRVLQKTVTGTSILDGLQILNGTNSNGAGLNCSAGSLNIYNCVFTNNRTSGGFGGGAIYQLTTSANNIFSNCTFIGNIQSAAAGGGAIRCENICTNLFQSCTFVTNGNPTANSANGGALQFNAAGPQRFQNCVFTNNFVSSQGGAIYCAGVLQFSGTNNVFYNNYSGGSGGAIHHIAGVTNNIFSNCTFIANRAGSGSTGGAIHFSAACTTMVQNCSFVANTLSGGNGSGGAIYLSGAGYSTLANCTFFTNSATGSGSGGAVRTATSGSTLGVTNCIFWGNATGGGSGTNIQVAGTLSIGFSDMNTNAGWITGGTITYGYGIFNSDPLFASQTEPYDLHAKSVHGRWNGSAWVRDTVTSPTIDSGCVKCDFSNEPFPNGYRVNMGRYGNTAEASKGANKTWAMIKPSAN